MFDQLHDLTHDLVRERLLDLRRERLADQAGGAEQMRFRSGRLAHLRDRLADHLGDLLIAWGARLKRGEPCQELTQGLAWQNRR